MSEPYILIVDDDEAVLDTLARMLQSAGHRVETAGNGGEALARIRAGLPALLITDLLLRGEHGLDLARVVKKEYFIPVLLISGVYDVSEIHDFMEEELVDGFLPKPVSSQELLARVKALLS